MLCGSGIQYKVKRKHNPHPSKNLRVYDSNKNKRSSWHTRNRYYPSAFLNVVFFRTNENRGKKNKFGRPQEGGSKSDGEKGKKGGMTTKHYEIEKRAKRL